MELMELDSPNPMVLDLSRPQRLSNIPLALELVFVILDYAQYDRGTIPNRKDLRNYALVCKDWSWYAQRLLFKNIILLTAWELHALKHALTETQPVEKAQWLRESIESALIRVDRGGTELRPIHAKEAAEILPLMPHIQVCELEVFTTTLSKRSDMDRFSMAPPFRTLHIHNNTQKTPALYDILYPLKGVKFLTLDRYDIPDHQPPTVYLHPQFSLYEFNYLARGPVPDYFLAWILSRSVNTLEILGFDREMPNPETFLGMMRIHGPSALRSLRISECNENDAFAIQFCTKLEELQVRHYPPEALVHVLLSVQWETLEHFSFSGCEPETVQNHHRLAQGLASDLDPVNLVCQLVESLPNLRVVTWNDCVHEDHPTFAAFHSLCSSRGVQLRYFYRRLGAFPGELEDVVAAAHFPRNTPLHKSRAKPRYPFSMTQQKIET